MTEEGAEGAALVAVERPVVLFDGVCNLCNSFVQFVLDHERGPELRFAALQSDAARALLASAGSIAWVDAELGVGPAATSPSDGESGESGPATIVFVERGRAYVRSTAALRIARYLRTPWRLLYVLTVVPRFLRDAVYRWIGKNRYRWFGKTETCRVPTPELRARFLDEG